MCHAVYVGRFRDVISFVYYDVVDIVYSKIHGTLCHENNSI